MNVREQYIQRLKNGFQLKMRVHGYSEYFAASKCGGLKRALAAAVATRELVLFYSKIAARQIQ
jgi:hypothetical protein